MAPKAVSKKPAAAAPAKSAAAAPAKKVAAPAKSNKKKAAFKLVGKNSVFNPTNKKSPLFVARKKNLQVGQDIAPRQAIDLTHYVRWPKYIRLQRQRRILQKRLRVPPAINQFSRALDKNTATELLKLLNKYRPEDAQAKKERRLKLAKAKAEGKPAPADAAKPQHVVHFGVNHVTRLVEQRKANLVVIAHDVDPIELVVWLPALCRKMNVPFVIVKSKARLGQVVHMKSTAVLALTSIKAEDKPQLVKVIEAARSTFNTKFEETRKQWGGGVLSLRTRESLKKRNIVIKTSTQ